MLPRPSPPLSHAHAPHAGTESSYNEQKIFTGWADPDLTNRGRDEARLAGQLLKATGIKRIDALYTSGQPVRICPSCLPRSEPPCGLAEGAAWLPHRCRSLLGDFT